MYSEETKMGYGNAEVRQAQIAGESMILAENCEVLTKMMDELSNRINPILRPEGGDPIRQQETKTEPIAPHADFLRARNSMLRQAITKLEGILRRIEL